MVLLHLEIKQRTRAACYASALAWILFIVVLGLRHAGLTAEQVLHDAEAEFDRVERDMYVIARQLWGITFPGKALPADTVDGRRDTIRKVLEELNKQHGKAEDLVKAVGNVDDRHTAHAQSMQNLEQTRGLVGLRARHNVGSKFRN